MPMDRFLIAPFNSGFQTNLKPWLIPDSAFESLINCYVFRGRITKRFGSVLTGANDTNQLSGRLRINIGNTDGVGNAAGVVPGAKFKIGQIFSVGTELYTVYQNGAPAAMLSTSLIGTGTYNTNTGAYIIAASAFLNTPIYFYPAEPVMGLTIYQSGVINDQPSYGFDTQFAYVFNQTTQVWERSGGPGHGDAIWHGGNLNFFWATNWRGVDVNETTMFVSNFQVTNMNGAATADDDPIWYTEDGTNWTPATGAHTFAFLPAPGDPPVPGPRIDAPYVLTAKIILPFKNRLILLNTVENQNETHNGIPGPGNTNKWYPQRARFSFVGSPLAQNAWYEQGQRDNSGTDTSKYGGAGFTDATTEEQIISAEFIKDRLIVFFERSTWELVYTKNEEEPFVWQKINTELGSEATFSSVPFDKFILTMGTTGIHSCNGANVQRIDTLIPDEIFQIAQINDGIQRVAGIRDYWNENVWWAFPKIQAVGGEVYPNRVLSYNYVNNTWALFEDSITCFGYMYIQSGNEFNWQMQEAWQNLGIQWNAGQNQELFRTIIFGNPEGFVSIAYSDVATNAYNLQITNIVNNVGGTITATIIDHELAQTENIEDYIQITQVAGAAANINGGIYQVTFIDENTVELSNPDDVPLQINGPYVGGGLARRVSIVRVLSKQWNPYADKDRNVHLHKIDFGFEKTQIGPIGGQITVEYFPSDTTLFLNEEGTQSGAIMGTGILDMGPYDHALYPLEQFQTRLWHPVYFQSDGTCIQIYMYWTAVQACNPAISLNPFEIQGFILYTQPTTQRLQ